MEPIKDCRNHIICYADVKTGLIETRYKKQMTKVIIPIGGEITIVRDITETTIKRNNDRCFDIVSIIIAA